MLESNKLAKIREHLFVAVIVSFFILFICATVVLSVIGHRLVYEQYSIAIFIVDWIISALIFIMSTREFQALDERLKDRIVINADIQIEQDMMNGTLFIGILTAVSIFPYYQSVSVNGSGVVSRVSSPLIWTLFVVYLLFEMCYLRYISLFLLYNKLEVDLVTKDVEDIPDVINPQMAGKDIELNPVDSENKSNDSQKPRKPIEVKKFESKSQLSSKFQSTAISSILSFTLTMVLLFGYKQSNTVQLLISMANMVPCVVLGFVYTNMNDLSNRRYPSSLTVLASCFPVVITAITFIVKIVVSFVTD